MASDLLKGVNVKVQPRSGFDKSRKNILTTKVGTLTPILSDLVIPNSDISIKMAISASLPPLASETFMRCSLKVEAFITPLRILYGGFESFLTGKEIYTNSPTAARAKLPRLKLDGNVTASLYGVGTLSDYLGARVLSTQFVNQGQACYLNLFPYLCYHRIYDDWYRNTKIQKALFCPPGDSTVTSTSTQAQKLKCLPWLSYSTIQEFGPAALFPDGVALGSLRQRNFGVDYFTSCTPNAQLGSPMTVQTDNSGLFSIAALRSSNSIQQWEELQNLTGTRMQDYCRANYGAKLSAGVAQRAVYLGSADFPVYSKGVYANQGVTATNNPFTSVGARYGSAYASGTDFIVKAHCDEPSWLMVLVSLVPEANYSSGVSALMTKFTLDGSQVDLPNPMLQNVGNEAVQPWELDGAADMDPASQAPPPPFGYLPRYTWHKTAVNEVHGLLRDGSSLDSFVAQRSFNTPQLGTGFLTIPTTALDQVTAVSSELSSYGCWIDSYIQYYVSMPLAQYSVPSLQNPAYEHGVSVHLENNGSKL